MMLKHSQNERGIALVIAIITLVVVGAVVTAGFAPVVLEQRQGESLRPVGRAFAAAEYGISETLGDWNTGAWNMLPVLDSATFTGTVPAGVGSYEGIVRRLNPQLFLLEVQGLDRNGVTRQRLGHFVKLQALDIDIQAALTTQGPTRIGGSAELDGNDAAPSGWTCGAADSTKAGLRISDEDDLDTNGGCSGGSCIDGNPPIEADSTVSDSTFFQYGDIDWDELVSYASVVMNSGTYKIEPTVTDGQCSASIVNWGDPKTPSSPCFFRFPIVYAPGDLNINGAFGQGILLVEGDLSVQGGFEFYGIAIVKGKLKTTGTGGHFNGAVLAANVDLDDNVVLGNALVQYSSCAVERALLAGSPGAPLTSRGWLYTF